MRINLDTFGRPMFDAEGDPAGGSGDLDNLKALGKEMGQAVETVKGAAAKVDGFGEKLDTLAADTEKDVAKLARMVQQVRSDLAVRFGPSGADDFLNDMAKFVRGAFAAKHGRKVSDEELIGGKSVNGLVGKAAADFTTTTDATAGYLVPDQLLPGIRELLNIYGNLYPLVTKVTAPAGTSVKMNLDAARPAAAWRGTQVSDIGEEATPMSFGQDTMTGELLGSWIQIANELLQSPGVNFGGVATVRMLDAILIKLETGLLAGTTGGGEPSDGIIADATSGGTIASMTFANLVTFLQTCIAANTYASSPARNAIIMHPADALALTAQAVSGNPGLLVVGNPREGVPATVLGYRLIQHPAAYSGSKKVILGDPSSITLVESPAFAVDFSEHAKDAFVENASILRVFRHYDWNIGQPTEWFAGTVTA